MTTLSLRAKLTLWYSLVLLVVLCLFGVDVLWQQQRIGLRRIDRELTSLTETLANVVRGELTELEDVRAAADEAINTVAVQSRAIAVLDVSGAPIAARWDGLQLAGWQPPEDGRTLVWTATTAAGSWRVHARRLASNKALLVLLVASPLSDAGRERREAQEAMLVGIPLVLLLTAVGGSWLASVGLRPINEMIARLGATLKTQRQFMADASHELRTPVSVVRTAAEVTLSRDHRDEPEYREALAIVGGQAKRLSRLVEDMLVLARADAGGYQLRPVDLYLDELIGECRRAVDVLAMERGVTIRTAAPSEIPFRGDEDLLRQLVVNVLQNAVQHSPSGSVVNIEAAHNGGGVTIRFSDSGPGIATDDQARIFDRFVQLDAARRDQGAGLGLPIARWIAEAHGGSLVLAASGPGGSIFCATLPSHNGMD